MKYITYSQLLVYAENPSEDNPPQFQKEFLIIQYQPGYEEEGSDHLGLIDGDE